MAGGSEVEAVVVPGDGGGALSHPSSFDTPAILGATIETVALNLSERLGALYHIQPEDISEGEKELHSIQLCAFKIMCNILQYFGIRRHVVSDHLVAHATTPDFGSSSFAEVCDVEEVTKHTTSFCKEFSKQLSAFLDCCFQASFHPLVSEITAPVSEPSILLYVLFKFGGPEGRLMLRRVAGGDFLGILKTESRELLEPRRSGESLAAHPRLASFDEKTGTWSYTEEEVVKIALVREYVKTTFAYLDNPLPPLPPTSTAT